MRSLSIYKNPWTPIVSRTPNYKRYQFPNAIFFRRRRLPMVIPRGATYRSVKQRRLHKVYAARMKLINNIGYKMSASDEAWLARYKIQSALYPDGYC